MSGTVLILGGELNAVVLHRRTQRRRAAEEKAAEKAARPTRQEKLRRRSLPSQRSRPDEPQPPKPAEQRERRISTQTGGATADAGAAAARSNTSGKEQPERPGKEQSGSWKIIIVGTERGWADAIARQLAVEGHDITMVGLLPGGAGPCRQHPPGRDVRGGQRRQHQRWRRAGARTADLVIAVSNLTRRIWCCLIAKTMGAAINYRTGAESGLPPGRRPAEGRSG